MAALVLLALLWVSQAEAAVVGLDLDGAHYRLSVFEGAKSPDSLSSVSFLEEKDSCISFTDTGRQYGSLHPANVTICGFFQRVKEDVKQQFEGLNEWTQRVDGSFATTLNGEEYTSEELAAMLLEHIRKTMEARYAQQTVEFALTVPSYWTRTQRVALMQLAEVAGMKVLGLVNRAASAALAFGFDRFDNDTAHYALVYALARDALEVSVVKFNATNKKTIKLKNVESIETLANSYSRAVGASAIDDKLVTVLLSHLGSVELTRAERTELRNRLRAAKGGLAQKDSVKVQVNKDVKAELKFSDLRESLEEYREAALGTVETALAEAGLAKEAINTLILLGKGSHNPAVQELLHDFFPPSVSTHYLDSEVTSRATALFACNQTTQHQLKPLWLTDISPFPVRVEFVDAGGFNKTLTLFGKGTKLGGKRQLSFTHDKSVKCLLSFMKGDTAQLFLSISTSGVEEFVKKYSQKPTQVFTFLYDLNGVPSLKWAEVRGEIFVENKTVPEKKDPSQVEFENILNPTPEPAESNVTAEGNTTADSNSTANATMIRKALSTPLSLQFSELAPLVPLSASDLKLLAVRLHDLSTLDHTAALLQEAKAKYLSGLSQLRSLLSEKSFKRVITELESTSLTTALRDAEDWIHSVQKVESWTVTERLMKLQAMFKDPQERLEELRARPQAIREGLSEIARLNATMSNLNLTKTWVPQKDKDTVFERLKEVKEWLLKVESEHKDRKPWEQPTVKVTQIQSKVSGAAKNVEKIEKTPRPKPRILKEKTEKPQETVPKPTEEEAENTPEEEDEETEQWEKCTGEDCESEEIARTEL